MRKSILLTVLLIITLPVCANAQWQELHNNEKSFYLETTSIIQNGSQYMYWVKSNNSDGYSKMLMVSDCSNNTSGVKQILKYNNSDKLLSKTDVNQNLEIIVPDSNASVAYNYICEAHFANLKKQAEEEAAITTKQQKKQNMENIINTGLGVGLYFLNK